jgi:hypothetical protein
MDWKYVGDVFTSNSTVLQDGFLSKEFVTIDFLGSFDNDPDPSKRTLVMLNNVGGNGGGDGCCSGTTSYFALNQEGPGEPFTETGGGQDMVDWGSFTPKADSTAVGLDRLDGTASRGFSMARTLGSEEPNQVFAPGRRVLIGWTGPDDADVFQGVGSAQSLPRELDLASDKSLTQRFVPELQTLREKHQSTSDASPEMDVGGLQAEVYAVFPETCGATADCSLSLLSDGKAATTITLNSDIGLVTVDATSQGNTAVRAGPMPPPKEDGGGYAIHAIVDRSILEIIVNNRTAFVVYAAPEETATGVAGTGVSKVDVWALKDAQNVI